VSPKRRDLRRTIFKYTAIIQVIYEHLNPRITDL